MLVTNDGYLEVIHLYTLINVVIIELKINVCGKSFKQRIRLANRSIREALIFMNSQANLRS